MFRKSLEPPQFLIIKVAAQLKKYSFRFFSLENLSFVIFKKSFVRFLKSSAKLSAPGRALINFSLDQVTSKPVTSKQNFPAR